MMPQLLCFPLWNWSELEQNTNSEAQVRKTKTIEDSKLGVMTEDENEQIPKLVC